MKSEPLTALDRLFVKFLILGNVAGCAVMATQFVVSGALLSFAMIYLSAIAAMAIIDGVRRDGY